MNRVGDKVEDTAEDLLDKMDDVPAGSTIIPAEISRTPPYKARRFWEPQWESAGSR